MTDRSGPSDTSLSVDGLHSYVECPRRYEFAHVDALTATEQSTDRADRLECVAASCRAAMAAGGDQADRLAAGLERLQDGWDADSRQYHSIAQRDHDRSVLRATVRAFVEDLASSHGPGCHALATVEGLEPVGPALSVSRAVPLEHANDGTAEPEPTVTVDAPLDYLTRLDRSLVGVRFVISGYPLGLLRYRSSWEGDVAALFTDHFDDRETHEPGPVGALLETSVVLAGLRTLVAAHDLDVADCRYLQVPLLDRPTTAVNWVSGSVETALEPVDLTDPYVEEQSYAMSHQHRNRTVDSRLERVVGDLAAGQYAPGERFSHLRHAACPRCPYRDCCQEYLASEVVFDG